MNEKMWEYLLRDEISDILETEGSGAISVYSSNMESYLYPLSEWSDKCRAVAESMDADICFKHDREGNPIILIRKKK